MSEDNIITTARIADGAIIGAARVWGGVPASYRLARRPDGTVNLQGAYQWQQGGEHGHEWRDIPTVEIP